MSVVSPICFSLSVTPSLSISITGASVRRELKMLKARKPTGLDGIGSRLLQDCADQLSEVFLHIFNLSLSLERVPFMWKISCVVPVPKDCTPQGAQPLQTRHLNFAPHQDLVEDCIKPSPGELVHGPTAIYISAWNWGG